MELSIRAYAKYRKVTEAAVRKAIKSGRISKNKNDKIDPILADKDWQENTNPTQINNLEITKEIEEINKTNKISDKKTKKITNNNPKSISPSYQESRAIKEKYHAKLSKLQYEKESERVMPVSEVAKIAFDTARVIRDRMLNIPDRIAPHLIGQTDIFKTKEILKTEITKALEELSNTDEYLSEKAMSSK